MIAEGIKFFEFDTQSYVIGNGGAIDQFGYCHSRFGTSRDRNVPNLLRTLFFDASVASRRFAWCSGHINGSYIADWSLSYATEPSGTYTYSKWVFGQQPHLLSDCTDNSTYNSIMCANTVELKPMTLYFSSYTQSPSYSMAIRLV
jgi:hypothetical protein